MPDSCTTNNDSQANPLRKSLTTGAARITILATMSKKPLRKPGAAVTAEIYAKRQVRRPHYLGELMELKNVSRGMLIEELNVDKSLVSRWLDEDRPSTPSPVWAKRLGQYFAPSDDPDDLVDIFTDPNLARFQKITRHMTLEEVDKMLTSIEIGYRSAKRAG